MAEADRFEDGSDGAVPAGSTRTAFVRGLREFPVVPAIILLSAVMGFGALARDLGLDLGVAVFSTAAIFALPGQVALLTEQLHGASLVATALAVALTATRLLPMAVVLAPYLRGSRLPRWMLVPAIHFCAVTLWVTGMRRLPELAPADRLPYFLGSALPLYGLALLTTAIGFLIAGEVPVLIAAALFFLTPIYFVLSMIQSAMRSPVDRLAIVFGLGLGPVLARLTPGLDLLLAGLVGGTAAYLIGRWRRVR
ncbi:MAG: AzlC family ABC transporter permease [Hyphomicrobiaceae bacterium]